MQHVVLSSFDKERCSPFFDTLTDYFHQHHHSEQGNAEGYEELLYMVRRPYTPEMPVSYTHLTLPTNREV